jgi:hypothetical protein
MALGICDPADQSAHITSQLREGDISGTRVGSYQDPCPIRHHLDVVEDNVSKSAGHAMSSH